MLNDNTVPYEILIRFGSNGEVIGAHVCYRRIVEFEGEILKDEILPASPISTENLPESEVLSQALAMALEHNQQLQTQLEAYQEK